jgi:WD40 repeat protein
MTSVPSCAGRCPGRCVVSGSRDHTTRLWDLRCRAETARLQGHTGPVTALAVLPDGRLASGSRDKAVRLWDLSGGAETVRLQGHDGPVTALAVLPDGRLASGSLDKTVRLWDLSGGAERRRREVSLHRRRRAGLCPETLRQGLPCRGPARAPPTTRACRDDP